MLPLNEAPISLKGIMKIMHVGNSLAVQWLGLPAFTAVGPGSIPGQGTKIPQAMRRGQKEKKNACIYLVPDGTTTHT